MACHKYVVFTVIRNERLSIIEINLLLHLVISSFSNLDPSKNCLLVSTVVRLHEILIISLSESYSTTSYFLITFDKYCVIVE